MKISNFIDLEVENEEMKVKSLKRPDFGSNMVMSEEKIKSV